MTIFAIIIVIGGVISAFFFRKGGIYNPRETPLEAPKLPVQPSLPITPPSMPKPSMLETFCHAIEAFEGGPGDPNHKNCNPGDFRCSPVGYLPKYGDVKCSPGGFAVFPTYQLGWEYLIESVHHRAVAHPRWTIYDFFNNYAPPTDNNPTRKYAETVAKACGVIPLTTLKDLFS